VELSIVNKLKGKVLFEGFMKYLTLLKILDGICEEAPLGYKSYKAAPSDTDKLVQARSKAFIHLFLKVKSGVDNFREREAMITDGSNDGGIDAYYIDSDKKKLYLIQSKFRATKQNFEGKSITADELVRMEIKRILEGEDKDSNGNNFNTKIKRFQQDWANIRDQANYEYIVVILGNLKRYNDRQIRRLVENSKYEILDYKKTYDELVFPICSGTYYEPKEITIEINLLKKTQPILKQKIETQHGEYDIRILFVPTKEIGRVLSEYKNSMLQYNPRNYLTLSGNPVNRKIKESILGSETNEFAILNNGITMIASSFKSTETTGKKGTGQVIITKPEIINGGQTAYVLSNIFEDKNIKKRFGNKEVMLKVITIDETSSNKQFIEEISNATNQQTKVKEADRRSNDTIQIELQKLTYDNFGYFYGRKKGEFQNGFDKKYLNRKSVIDRTHFIKAYLGLKGDSSEARGSEDKLFATEKFKQILGGYKKDFKKMMFAYLTLQKLHKLSSELSSGPKKSKWGYGLRYGKMAIIAAIGAMGFEQRDNIEEMQKEAAEKLKKLESRWRKFEKWAKQQKGNVEYVEDDVLNFDNYYKGKTVNKDIRKYFGTN
jgi:hypothetical protein